MNEKRRQSKAIVRFYQKHLEYTSLLILYTKKNLKHEKKKISFFESKREFNVLVAQKGYHEALLKDFAAKYQLLQTCYTVKSFDTNLADFFDLK